MMDNIMEQQSQQQHQSQHNLQNHLDTLKNPTTPPPAAQSPLGNKNLSLHSNKNKKDSLMHPPSSSSNKSIRMPTNEHNINDNNSNTTSPPPRVTQDSPGPVGGLLAAGGGPSFKSQSNMTNDTLESHQPCRGLDKSFTTPDNQQRSANVVGSADSSRSGHVRHTNLLTGNHRVHVAPSVTPSSATSAVCPEEEEEEEDKDLSPSGGGGRHGCACAWDDDDLGASTQVKTHGSHRSHPPLPPPRDTSLSSSSSSRGSLMMMETPPSLTLRNPLGSVVSNHVRNKVGSGASIGAGTGTGTSTGSTVQSIPLLKRESSSSCSNAPSANDSPALAGSGSDMVVVSLSCAEPLSVSRSTLQQAQSSLNLKKETSSPGEKEEEEEAHPSAGSCPSEMTGDASHAVAAVKGPPSSQSTRSTTPVPTGGGGGGGGGLGGGNSKSKNQHLTRTPVRTPKSNQYSNVFQTHGSSDMPHFGSPSIFLSPYLPSPPDTLEKKNHVSLGGGGGGYNVVASSGIVSVVGGGGSGVAGGGGKRHDGGMTPTNFASDFGKTDFHEDSLNHVLPWLSPNAYGLFSPGGFTTNSIHSTTDKQSDGVTGNDTNQHKPSLPFDEVEDHGGMMICVSPLARKNTGSYGKGPKQPDTPINFHEVFASPKSDGRHGFSTTSLSNHEIPTISDSSKDVSSKMVLDRHHPAERDIKEDEDLNVLLKLAETTPRSHVDDQENEGKRVFRGGAGGSFAFPAGQPVGPPSYLHLPLIGKNTPPTSLSSLKKVERKVDTKGMVSSPKKRKHPDGHSQQKPSKTLPLHRSAPAYCPPSFLHPAASGTSTTGMYSLPHHLYSRNSQGPPSSYIYNPKTLAGADTAKGLNKKSNGKTSKSPTPSNANSVKRPLTITLSTNKKVKKDSKGRGPSKKKLLPAPPTPVDKQKAAETISAINTASGKKNDKAASLASAILRGVTMRPSGKWQAQLYFAGKSRYIGVFDSREKAALAYEIAREHLQDKSVSSSKDTETHVNAARKAAFEGVNETDPRLSN